MTISLNLLFSTAARQNVQLAEETSISATVNPFAELFAAQLQPPVAELAPALLKDDLPAAVSENSGAAQPGDVSLLLAAGAAAPVVLNTVQRTGPEFAAGLSGGKAVENQAAQWQVSSTASVDPLAAAAAAAGSAFAGLHANGEEIARAVTAKDPVALQVQAVVDDVRNVPLTSPPLPAEIRSEMLKAVANDRPAGKLSESVKSSLSAPVKDLVSFVTSGLPEGKAKDLSDVLVATAGRSPVARPELLVTGGLRDKGFAVRIETEMAISASSSTRDAIVPAMMQSPLMSQGGQVIAEPVTVSIAEPMAKANAWGEAFGKQLITTAAAGLDKTTIQVNPEHLGPLEISITMNKDQAQIMVVAANPQARDIVEHHLPALSRMMEQAGLQLADAQVSSQQQGQNQGQEHGRRAIHVDQEAVAELNAQADDVQDIVTSGLKIQA